MGSFFYVNRGARWGKIESLYGEFKIIATVDLDGGSHVERPCYLVRLRCHGAEYGGVKCMGDFWVSVNNEPVAYLHHNPKQPEYYMPDLWPHKFPGRKKMRDCGCIGRAGVVGGGLSEGPQTNAVDFRVVVMLSLELKARLQSIRQGRNGEQVGEVLREMLWRGVHEAKQKGMGVLEGKMHERGVHRNPFNLGMTTELHQEVMMLVDRFKLPKASLVTALVKAGIETIETGGEKKK